MATVSPVDSESPFHLDFPDNSLDDDLLIDMPASGSGRAISEDPPVRASVRKPSLLNISALNASKSVGLGFTPVPMESTTVDDISASRSMEPIQASSRFLPGKFLSRLSIDRTETSRNETEKFPLPPLFELPPSPERPKFNTEPLRDDSSHHKDDKTVVTVFESASSFEPEPIISHKQKIPAQPVAIQREERNEPFDIELSLSETFDRSIDNFMRLFQNEFKALMKPSYAPLFAEAIDSFSTELVDIVDSEIRQPLFSTNAELMAAKMSGNIGKDLKDTIDFTVKGLKRRHELQKQLESSAAQDLKELISVIDDLCRSVKSSDDKLLRELNRERIDTSAVRDSVMTKAKYVDMRAQKLKIAVLELENKHARQTSELNRVTRESASIQISITDLIKKRESASTQDGRLSDSKSISTKIEQLKDIIQEETHANVAHLMEILERDVSGMTDKLRGELLECGVACKHYGEFRAIHRKMKPRKTKQKQEPEARNKASLADIAKLRLEELRERRNAALAEAPSSVRKRQI